MNTPESRCDATVLLPTTGNRWPLVELALDCMRRQTVRDIEIFIIGDGVADESRRQYEAWEEEDPRVRFFDFPKHPRRGEPYRHELLTKFARGGIVTYCCDRDLWFPHHIETLLDGLQHADFAHTLTMEVPVDGPIFAKNGDLGNPRYRRRVAHDLYPECGLRLSNVGHTLEAYRRLPEGWRETPRGKYTDYWMWRKFLRQADIRTITIPRATLLYFKRDHHPGWPVEQRLEELRRWLPRTMNSDGYLECLEEFTSGLYAQQLRIWYRRSWLVRIADSWPVFQFRRALRKRRERKLAAAAEAARR
ncbi:MAG TPA: glycosyltransferase family 2 protein [Longimicrobiales bacterium]|nr:glycosyltransferase family 2 protein [Longimicrobiales bacterium]